MMEQLQEIARYLGVKPESLERLSTDVQTELVQALEQSDGVDQAYELLKAIWTEAIIQNDLKDVARLTGISMKLLKVLPTEVKMELLFVMSEDDTQIAALHEIVNHALATAALPDISILLKEPYEALMQLPFETKKQLCGIFEMEYGITPDAELVASIRSAMKAGVAV